MDTDHPLIAAFDVIDDNDRTHSLTSLHFLEFRRFQINGYFEPLRYLVVIFCLINLTFYLNLAQHAVNQIVNRSRDLYYKALQVVT